MSDIRPLTRSYVSVDKVPTISAVDTEIFKRRYFAACMQCTFCHDSCCQYGADIDIENVARVLAVADELEAVVGIPRDEWFTDGEADDEYPGGIVQRTVVKDGACLFLDRAGRGCRIHAFALARGDDYHRLKPTICSLFPVTYYDETLCVAEEVDDRSLVCVDQGPTVYRAQRDELRHYFGTELIAELDAIEASLER